MPPDTGFRLDGLPILSLWEKVIEVVHPDAAAKTSPNAIPLTKFRNTFANELLRADWVPPSLPPHRGLARLFL